MKNMEIFDPAMCCPTGICGPSIDPDLLRIATAIATLKHKGVIIKRHGLSSEPQAFMANKTVAELLKAEGVEVLPITLLDGEVARKGSYPLNSEIEEWLGVEIKAIRRKGTKNAE